MQFAVIGLGVFGRTCAYELQRLGNDVLGIDKDNREVDAVSGMLSHAVIADATVKDTLLELNLSSLDGVLVSIGDNLEASLLCTLNLINLPVKNLWVKAKTDAQHAILESLGVRNIIHPEQDMGMRIAQAMNYPTMKQYLSLGRGHFLVRIDVPVNWQPQSVAKVRNSHPQTSLVIVYRENDIIRSFNDDMKLQHPDRLVFSGHFDDLKRLAKYFSHTR